MSIRLRARKISIPSTVLLINHNGKNGTFQNKGVTCSLIQNQSNLLVDHKMRTPDIALFKSRRNKPSTFFKLTKCEMVARIRSASIIIVSR